MRLLKLFTIRLKIKFCMFKYFVYFNKYLFRTFTSENASVEDFMHVHIDFCSEKLYDYFIDRKFYQFNNNKNEKDNQKEKNDAESNIFLKKINVIENSLVQNLLKSNINDDSLLLAPPPNPPKTFSVNKTDFHVELSSNNNIHNNNNFILSDSFLSRFFLL